MARDVVNIDVALPPDIVFKLGDEEFRLRGNLEASVALELMRLVDDLDKAWETEEVRDHLVAQQELNDYLLGLFREKQPKLDHLPFDIRAAGKVAGVILARIMGIPDDRLQEIGDPTPAKTTPAQPRRSSPSTRRTGSQRS